MRDQGCSPPLSLTRRDSLQFSYAGGFHLNAQILLLAAEPALQVPLGDRGLIAQKIMRRIARRLTQA